MANLEALKEDLLRSDEEFRQLHQQHQECERRLEELAQKSLLSQEDEMEEKQIKKKKLTLKDRMAELMRQHQEAASVTA